MLSRREVVAGALLAATVGKAHGAENSQPILRTRFAFEAIVTVAAPLMVGPSSRGLRRIVPITGGTVKGPQLNGRVVSGGADWQVIRPDDVLDVEAKYTLQADDGTLIIVSNKGMRHGPKEIIDKLTHGEAVDPSLYYFRTTAQFEVASDSKHVWLNRAMFVGVGERRADSAVIQFHEVL
jgi:hypothetical protein